ncbi:MAG: twin-arginine translocase subunit TatC [Bacteroidales bacterium]|nr:twin-arginine translocase subunit TatC [Bacteroidales bacterium]
MAEEYKSFWEHLDDLRSSLLRILAVVGVCAVVAFFFKSTLFEVVLAPRSSDFVTYRWLLPASSAPFRIELVNIELTQQFMIHLKVSLLAGLLVAMPYVVFESMRYISPALYERERRPTIRAVVAGYVMFMLGVVLTYYVLFPFTLRFLGTYQVDAAVPNVVSITSYVSTLLLLCIVMGVLFEMPVLGWLMARIGMLRSEPMSRYRRHAVVVILCLSAVITPSGDAFTLCLVAVPIYALYELTILTVKRTERHRHKEAIG